jgi:hypothetical protein
MQNGWVLPFRPPTTSHRFETKPTWSFSAVIAQFARFHDVGRDPFKDLDVPSPSILANPSNITGLSRAAFGCDAWYWTSVRYILSSSCGIDQYFLANANSWLVIYENDSGK